MTAETKRAYDPDVIPAMERFGATMMVEGLTIEDWRQRYAGLMAEQGIPTDPVSTRDLTIPTRHGEMKARLYLPAEPSPALLVYAHGGGFVVGDLDTLEVPLHAVSRGSGVAILSLDYALAPEHRYPIALEQCQDGLLWADQHRAELGVDGPLGVGGDSAGGNFAALLSQWAVATGGPALEWQVLINPVLDFPAVEKASTESHRLYGDSPMLSTEAMQVFLASYFRSPADTLEASPLCADIDCSTLPPAFIAVGECDALHEDSVAYAEKLRAAGVPVQLEVYQGMPHNFMTLTKVSGTARRFLQDFTAASAAWAGRANARHS